MEISLPTIIFFIGILCFVAIVALFILGVAKNSGIKKFKKPAIALAILGALLIIFSDSFVIIPTGFTGVKTTFGQVDSNVASNGFSFKIPFIQNVAIVNNKQQDISFSDNTISSETSERNEVFFSGITVTYQINPEKSAWIFANVSNYEDNLVTESIVSSAIKTSSKKLTPNDVTNRSILEPIAKENIQASLDEKYGEEVVMINKVVITNATFDEAYNQKLAEKQQAQMSYETQQIENQKNIETAEAEATVTKTKAQAEADAEIIAANAEAQANNLINGSINDNILKNKYYEKWNGTLPTTLAGGDASIILGGN